MSKRIYASDGRFIGVTGDEKDARIADLNGLMDMMRENAVDREQRIAELEARNEVQRVHLEEQIERIAELEARAEALYEKRLPYREAEVAQARYEQAEAERDALQDKLEYVGANVGFPAWQAMRDFDKPCEGGE